jgi:hypothetical protein
MSGPRSAIATIVVLTIASAAMACGSSGPTGSALTPPTASPTSSASPAAPASPVSSPSPADGPGGEPPDATLLVPDGEPIVGQLGGWTWGDSGADSPWLSGTPVTVDRGGPLAFGLSVDVPVDDWAARYAPPGDPFPTAPLPLAKGDARIEVVAPPPGTWTVVLRLTFAGGFGDASYYWHVRVE